MSTFPICIKLDNLKVLIIGGGKVAERKVATLSKFTKDITILSPELTFELQKIVQTANFQHLQRKYQVGDLNGFQLVFITTNNSELNLSICKEARSQKILVNAADIPELCDFYLPALVQRGNLNISISTDGHAPALAKRIRQDLEKRYDQDYSFLTNLVHNIRIKALKEHPGKDLAPDFEIFLANLEQILELKRNNQQEQIQHLIQECFGFMLEPSFFVE